MHILMILYLFNFRDIIRDLISKLIANCVLTLSALFLIILEAEEWLSS